MLLESDGEGMMLCMDVQAGLTNQSSAVCRKRPEQRRQLAQSELCNKLSSGRFQGAAEPSEGSRATLSAENSEEQLRETHLVLMQSVVLASIDSELST